MARETELLRSESRTGSEAEGGDAEGDAGGGNADGDDSEREEEGGVSLLEAASMEKQKEGRVWKGGF